jgi:hypothetical protein
VRGAACIEPATSGVCTTYLHPRLWRDRARLIRLQAEAGPTPHPRARRGPAHDDRPPHAAPT